MRTCSTASSAESWAPGLARHEKRALELATILQDAPADFVVETDGRSIIDIAGEILGLVENETGIPAP